MRQKIQRIIYFSTQKIKDLIEGYFADESELEGKSATVLIEEHLLESIMPRNRKYWTLAENLIVNKTGVAMGRTMDSLFSILAAGISNKASHDNGFNLVKFAYDNKLTTVVGHNPLLDQQDIRDVKYYYQELKYFSDYLNELANEKKEYDIELDARDIAHIYSIEQDENFVFNDSLNRVYMAILSNWDELGNWTYTYRLLCAISRLQNWYSTAETRLELVKVIDEVTYEWD